MKNENGRALVSFLAFSHHGCIDTPTMHQTHRRMEVMAAAERLLGDDKELYYTLGQQQVTPLMFADPTTFVEPIHHTPPPDAKTQVIQRFLYDNNASHAVFLRPRARTDKLRFKDLAVPNGLVKALCMMVQGPGWSVRHDPFRPKNQGRCNSLIITEPFKEYEIQTLEDGSHSRHVTAFFDIAAEWTVKTIAPVADRHPILMLFWTVPPQSLVDVGDRMYQTQVIRGDAMVDDIGKGAEEEVAAVDEPADVDPARVRVSLNQVNGQVEKYANRKRSNGDVECRIRPIPSPPDFTKPRKALTPLEYLVSQPETEVPSTIVDIILAHLKTAFEDGDIDASALCSFTDRVLHAKADIDLTGVNFADSDAVTEVVRQLLDSIIPDTSVDIAPRTVKEYVSFHGYKASSTTEARFVPAIIARWALRLQWAPSLCVVDPTSIFSIDYKHDSRSATRELNPVFARSTTRMKGRMSELHRRLMVCALVELAALMNQRKKDLWPKMIHTFLETIPDPAAAAVLRRDNARELVQWLVTWNCATYALLDKVYGWSIKASVATATKPKPTKKRKVAADDDTEVPKAKKSKNKPPKESTKRKAEPKDGSKSKRPKTSSKSSKSSSSSSTAVSTSLPLVSLANPNSRLELKTGETDVDAYMSAFINRFPAPKGISRSFKVLGDCELTDARRCIAAPIIQACNLQKAPVLRVYDDANTPLYLMHHFDEQDAYTFCLCPFHPTDDSMPVGTDWDTFGVTIGSTSMVVIEAALRAVEKKAPPKVLYEVHEPVTKQDENDRRLTTGLL